MGLDMYLYKIHDNYFKISKEQDKIYDKIQKECEKLAEKLENEKWLVDIAEKHKMNKNNLAFRIIMSSVCSENDNDDLKETLHSMIFRLFPIESDIDIFDDEKCEQFINKIFDNVVKIYHKIPEKIRNMRKKYLELDRDREVGIVELVYWRKANPIHGWFVRNVQNGVDDCGYYKVNKEQLQALLKDINTVLSSKNEKTAYEILPPTPGFFFGYTEICDMYWEDLEYTKREISKVIERYDMLVGNGWNIYYTSSW